MSPFSAFFLGIEVHITPKELQVQSIIMAIDLNKIKYKNLGFFRFKKLDKKYLLTNDIGFYVFLSEQEFEDFLQNNLAKNKEPYLNI